MASSNFNIRGIPAEVMSLLKKEAKRLKTSVNVLILKMIERGLGGGSKIVKPTYHDLDHLAGSWTLQEERTFNENTNSSERIDKEQW